MNATIERPEVSTPTEELAESPPAWCRLVWQWEDRLPMHPCVSCGKAHDSEGDVCPACGQR